MKKLITLTLMTLSISSFSFSAQAGGAGDFLKIIGGIIDAADGYDSNDSISRRGGGFYCEAVDRGHEEHWGGHSSCGSCLAEHGECIERCYDEAIECTVQGRDRYGYTREFRESGRRQHRVRDRAERRCYNSGYDSCIFQGCRSDKQLVSREACRDGGRGGRGGRRGRR